MWNKYPKLSPHQTSSMKSINPLSKYMLLSQSLMNYACFDQEQVDILTDYDPFTNKIECIIIQRMFHSQTSITRFQNPWKPPIFISALEYMKTKGSGKCGHPKKIDSIRIKSSHEVYKIDAFKEKKIVVTNSNDL